MSQIDWKKVEAKVKHLFTLSFYTLLATHNWLIMIGEIKNQQKINNKQTN